MLGNFGIFSFLPSWKLTSFLTTSRSATSFKIWTFSSFFHISLKRLKRIFLKSRHIIFIMYIIRSETFIETDSLQHLKISRQTYPTNRSKKCALQHSLFWRYANFSKLMRTIHISMTSTFQCKYCHCFTFKRCDKFKLKCTSHGGMYMRFILEKLA